MKLFGKTVSRRLRAGQWYHHPLPIPLVMALAFLFLMSPAFAKPAPALVKMENACNAATTAAQRAYGIPNRLLAAISVTESGIWNKSRQAQIAWPWTVYAQGRGRYLPSKSAAVAEVRQLQARGVRNIDVGCMQVNLKYHPKAFAGLEAAFDPVNNADYAAKLLRSLFKKHRSWSKAVEYYHSSTPKYRLPYRRKVMQTWHQQRRKSYAARSRAARVKYTAKRSRWLQRRYKAAPRRFAYIRLNPRLSRGRQYFTRTRY